ncbi:steroid 17-alpha-hydroxylase/17,20 lyase-like [Diadema antillarum]|uniref:steroid 17-alpha-hydroxylase/17,20 lyase-like n=1 Tax=Diadema antillarum TaxID=105358 RepID=UPI003A83C3B5
MDNLSADRSAASLWHGHISVAASVVLGVIIIAIALVKNVMRPRRFPPGPPGLPLIGNILELNDRSEILLDKFMKKYGDIFSLRVGERWVVVLNSVDMIKEAMLKRGAEFAGRPQVYSAEILSEGFKDIVFSPYTDTWKLHRKLAHSALRHFATGKNLDKLVHKVFPQAEEVIARNGDKPLDPKLLLTLTIYNVLSQMCFAESFRFDDPKLLKYIKFSREMWERVGFGLVADIFPWARYISTSGTTLMNDIKSQYLAWSMPQMERHKATFDPDNLRDFCDFMLLAQKEAIESKHENIDNLTDTHLVQTVNDIFIAGIETSLQRLYWFVALMAEHPDIQLKVQQEIDRVIGRDRPPCLADRGTLPYTEATVMESIRYSSVGPVGVPHSTTVDTEFYGYLIPKDTVVIINHFSMHFDPREWAEPNSFRPEHFLDPTGSMRQHPPSFLPFGTGRRSCLGEAVAKADLFLISSWLVQNYTISKPAGHTDVDLLQLQPESAAGRILKDYEVVIEKRS